MRALADRVRRLVRRHHAESYLLVSFLLVAAGLFVFLKLASEVAEGETASFDRWLLEALRSPADPSVPIGPRWLSAALIDVTALGGTTVLTLLTVAVVGYLVAARRAATAAFVAAAIVGGSLTASLLKLVFARARPDLVAHLVSVDSASFPSGHATNSAVTYLTLAVLLARAEERRSVRAYLMAVALCLTLGIGFSRVFLGVHWPTDVIAGWIIGASWALLCSLVARALQRRRAIEPEHVNSSP